MYRFICRTMFDSFFYCFLLFLPSSSILLYPSFERIVQQLSFNSTLPRCTLSTCQTADIQANFSAVNVSDEYLFKLAAYERRIPQKSSSFLVASTGIYRGKRIKYRDQRYIDQFLGIYYAEIPRSLAKPMKKHFNYSIQNAKRFSPCCMQSLTMTENLSYGSFIMQNDFHDNCLSLNIYRADLRYGDKRKAIMLFSHGGSNQIGGGSLFDGSILASEGDLIVITMNFRLNYHGFLSSGDERMKGNYGLWDQLLAVQWIYENAHLFGGDPQRITLAGHSAGAGNVMLIPASQHCRGMVKRVIAQSGTGLAPWSINHQPMKLMHRLSREFNCQRANDTEMFQCIYQLLQDRDGDFYRLHLSLNIADDNPYPVIDNDFLNNTIENLFQSDVYRNIDFLTGVTLNEGLYFAEYHIGHFYSDLNNQSSSIGQRSTTKQKRFIILNATGMIPPDILITHHEDGEDEDEEVRPSARQTHVEQALNYDPNVALVRFAKLNYVERYINANFQHGKCYMNEIKKRYEYPGKKNITLRLKLYIDLVSDLMFNFHMVHCLNLRRQVSNKTASTYAYVYAHKPPFKSRSLLRDHLKTLPHVIGHFAELDYVFGVPLARGFHRIHTNVNMSYYNYSIAEEEFSRQIIRYWSNFIKTGNPNKDSSSTMKSDVQWKSYTVNEHNYLLFQLNNIHTERNYFDSMYEFWSKIFQIESNGGCPEKFSLPKMKKHYGIVFIPLLLIVVSMLIYFLCKRYQKTKERYQPANNLRESPPFITT